MRYLIWDFDGTLAFREGGWSGAMLDTAKAHGIDCAITTAEIRPHILTGFRWHDPNREYDGGIVADAWWDELVPLFTQAFVAACNFTEEQARRLAREVRQQYVRPDAWKAYADSRRALDTLASGGYRHLLLTNHVPELLELLKHVNLTNAFERVFNSAKTGYEKPHPKAYTNVLATIPGGAQVTMIGDNPTADYAGAKAAGINAILVRRHTPGLVPYFADLDALTHYLMGLTKPHEPIQTSFA